MPDAVTYTATLPVARATVDHVVALLEAQQAMIGTRTGRRSLGCFDQAVAFLRWMLNATEVLALPLHRRGLGRGDRSGTRAARRAGGGQGGRLPARDDRRDPDRHRPIPRHRPHRWGGPGGPPACGGGWSGKHHHHGANIQVVTAPDGWPIWTSPVRPGREHDTTCARTHPGLLDALDAWSDEDHHVLADLGYEGEAERMIVPVKKKCGVKLTVDQACFNALHCATRALAERGNALLNVTFTALRHVSISPGRIGAMTAALVILHLEHHRTV